MARPRLTRILTLGLGALYVGAGSVLTVREPTDRGLWLLATLVGGGALVLLGVALTRSQPHIGRGLVCVGSMMGVLATAWTVVVPILAIAVVSLNLRESSPL